MNNFQIALLGIFTIFAAIGVFLFATYGGDGVNKDSIGQVTIWGTINQKTIDNLLEQVKISDDIYDNVVYVEKKEELFNGVLVEALATDTGPDIFMLPQSEILSNKNKILPIPYESYSIRDFKDSFIEEGELYLDDSGIIAFPFTIDPIVMYWNRDIFASAGLAKAPTAWEEFLLLSQQITEIDSNSNILKSAVALGEFRNINNAKEILSMLILQTGNPIIQNVGSIKTTLTGNPSSSIPSAEASINFFTQFSNPIKTVYSWNKSLRNSIDTFASGDLAIYFGFASELSTILTKNPNLNFDVTLVPQIKNAKTNITFGNIQALAISRDSRNVNGAFKVISRLISDDFISDLSEALQLPPVKRNLISKKPSSPDQEIFYKAALSSKAFLDPSPKETDIIFQDIINSVTSGRSRTSEAVRKAEGEMQKLLN
jgi:multiple sugar transport system substrate-binding protein